MRKPKLSTWQAQRERLGLGTVEYIEGRNAAFDGLRPGACPYAFGMVEYVRWNYGWRKAPIINEL